MGRCAASLVVAVAVAACFSPTTQPGLPCSPEGDCPAGQECSPEGVCVVPGGGDGPIGSDGVRSDAPLACVTWTAPNIGDPCALPAPAALVLTIENGGWEVDSDDGTIRHGQTVYTPPSVLIAQSNGTQLRVFSLTDLVVPDVSSLDIDGTHAVVFAVHGSVTIAGAINASASTIGSGPGAPSPQCTLGTDARTGSGQAGGGGGAGGSFGGHGGAGTRGAEDGLGGMGGEGGTASGAWGPGDQTPLTSGCVGAQGAGPTLALGGGAGGAVEITARDLVVVTGVIAASGGGGRGGAARTGGGGGGAGGGILIDGDVVMIAAGGAIVANGGGGGEGGATLGTGASGSDGQVSSNGAPGGTSINGGGNGGVGGRRGNEPGGDAAAATTPSSGGGGGGGGAGRIKIIGRSARDIDGNAIVSPAPN